MICPKNKHLVYPLNFSMLWHNEGAFHFLWLSIFIKQILFLPIYAYRKIKHFKSCFRHDNWCTTDGGILVCLNAHVLRFLGIAHGKHDVSFSKQRVSQQLFDSLHCYYFGLHSFIKCRHTGI